MATRSLHTGDVLPYTLLPEPAVHAAYDSLLNRGFAKCANAQIMV